MFMYIASKPHIQKEMIKIKVLYGGNCIAWIKDGFGMYFWITIDIRMIIGWNQGRPKLHNEIFRERMLYIKSHDL